jgi:hypothetical protein
MKRTTAGTIVAAVLIACSDDPGRRPADDPAGRPVEVARADSALITLGDTADPEVTPVEELPPQVESRPRPAPPKARVRRPVPKPQPEPTSEPEQAASLPAPEPATPEPLPAQTDTVRPPAPDSDTLPTVPAESVPEPARSPVPPPARAPDTIGTSRPVPADSPGPVVPSMEASGASSRDAVTLPAGTEFHAALVDSIHSRHDSVGQSLRAKVMQNVLGADGSTLIPAGAPVRLTVVRLEPAKSKSSADGTLELKVEGITRGDEVLEVAAEVRPVPHELRGRGVTGSEAAKVGVGAAAGAIAGRVLGGDTRGAVIGGVVGAAGGAAVASQTADRDVVVKAGTPISFVLTAPLVAGRL